MPSFENLSFGELVVHFVGNKTHEEYLSLSERAVNLAPEVEELLKHFFLTPFKTETYYHFDLEKAEGRNSVFELVKRLFDNESDLVPISRAIAELLYEESTHPKIKGGEFYVVYFKDCIVEDEIADAIGLFKSENKETFIKVYETDNSFDVSGEEGININKLDKGCLIFNTEQEHGYKVSIVDNLNKGAEAQYWLDAFLKVKLRDENFYHTQNYMNMCLEFVDEVLTEEKGVDKLSKVAIKNDSAKYFKEKEDFSEEEFVVEVIQQPEIIEAFKEYKEEYKERPERAEQPVFEEFNISPNAVKSTNKFFKSVLKLDKNFHVYIHGNKENVEQGFDEEKGMKYYKLFYNEEKE
ncbi:nucleoid-associated protein [Flammeovirgaceae bacterium SG7u.111]|nr:nucleoid-associated protein [Flammeovirgaceae bacterium SG7u.132]WPO34490.1 nucleoid-associated protein [Flammeovirgaceae bacterium SG7u.111]